MSSPTPGLLPPPHFAEAWCPPLSAFGLPGVVTWCPRCVVGGIRCQLGLSFPPEPHWSLSTNSPDTSPDDDDDDNDDDDDDEDEDEDEDEDDDDDDDDDEQEG